MKSANVVQFVAAAIDASGKSREQIATEAGMRLVSVNLILKGDAKLPIDKVTPLAEALQVDPKALMSVVLGEYMPATWTEIQRVYGFTV